MTLIYLFCFIQYEPRISSSNTSSDVVFLLNKGPDTVNNPLDTLQGNFRKYGKLTQLDDNKSLPIKLYTGKLKKKGKKTKSNCRNEDVIWGLGERFYSSTSDTMPDSENGIYMSKKDGLELRKTNSDTTHYKLVSERIVDAVNGGWSGGDQYKDGGDFICNKAMSENSRFVISGKNFSDKDAVCSGSPVSKPSAKIKPYTVVDLSTMAALTPQEVENCLEEKAEVDHLHWLRYGVGDEAPDSVELPPKLFRQRSNTTGLILNKPSRNIDDGLDEPGSEIFADELRISEPGGGYSFPGQHDGLNAPKEMSSFRQRSRTAPSVSRINQCSEKNGELLFHDA